MRIALWIFLGHALGETNWYLVNEWQHEFQGSATDRADVLNEFFTGMSVGQSGVSGDGLDEWGNYVVGGSRVKVGLQTKQDLQAWPLTFPAGHPFYSTSGAPTWGQLAGQDWKGYARQTATPIDLSQTSVDILKTSVLVVENANWMSHGPQPVLLTDSDSSLQSAKKESVTSSTDQCVVTSGYSFDGAIAASECGNLEEYDCCVRCFQGRGDCVAVELKDGCCTYFSAVQSRQSDGDAVAIDQGSSPTPSPTPLPSPVPVPPSPLPVPPSPLPVPPSPLPPSPPSPGNTLELMGIVVRKGGILLIDDLDLNLRVQFIIVESGGLLQAGSHANDDFRFKSKLTITLIHDPESDYANTPVPASQYSAEIHHPGYSATGPGNTLEDFAGMGGTNHGGPKAINVFFNGNLQLNGLVPSLVAYKHTWKAMQGNNDWDHVDPLTADGSSVSSDYQWPSAYHMVWARLASPGASKGDVTIQLEADDFNQNSLVQGRTWAEGDQVLITARTSQFTDTKQALGMPRVWMDNQVDSASFTDNEAANQKFKDLLGGSTEDAGVEVATISTVSSDGVITFKSPLKFTHRSENTALTDSSGRSLDVHTRLHVGWLSRRITITSEQTSGGGGCNNIPSSVATPRNGPMGAVVNNFGQGYWSGSPGPQEIRQRCFEKPNEDTEFTGREGPEKNIVGHWMFGTSGLSGCNSIWGGQQLFRYGSSVSLDGVQVTKMGTPGNFGKMGQYAIHFHMAGYAKSFKDYLPAGAKEKGYSRELRVVSSSIWRTYVRWATVHGTMEAEIRNNVGFLTYGSGYFVEDGTEVHNIFDHNMGIMAMPAVRNAYWNPSPIYPYVSTDYGPMSTFWFKNNQNIFTRNVMANSPTPVIGVWYVPQKIGMLRGPSAVCIGSEKLGLPGIASEASASGPHGALNSQNANNRNGVLFGFEKVCGGTSCTCYVPDDFEFPLLNPQTGCNVYTADNQATPIMTNSENVVYNMLGFYSEFPEGIENGPLKYNGDYTSVLGVGFVQQFNADKEPGPAPQFLPRAGQNDCTDGHIAIDIYPVPRWDMDGLRWQPLSREEFSSIDEQCNVQTPQIGSVGASQIPKMIANLLLWNTGPEVSGLWYGAGWMKNVPPMFINCALLSDADGDATANANIPQGQGTVQGKVISSTNFVWGYRLPNKAMVGTVGYYRNLILSGGLATIPMPTVFTGRGTFIDTRSVFGGSPIEGAGGVAQDAPAFNYFFDDLAGSVDAIFGDLWLRNEFPGNMEQGAVPAVLQLIDMTAKLVKRIRLQNGETITPWTAVQIGQRYLKFPYLCGDADDNWGLRRANGSMPSKLVISLAIGGLFESDLGHSVGDEICQALSLTLPRLPPSDTSGNPVDSLVCDSLTAGCNKSEACAQATHLLAASHDLAV